MAGGRKAGVEGNSHSASVLVGHMALVYPSSFSDGRRAGSPAGSTAAIRRPPAPHCKILVCCKCLPPRSHAYHLEAAFYDTNFGVKRLVFSCGSLKVGTR